MLRPRLHFMNRILWILTLFFFELITMISSDCMRLILELFYLGYGVPSCTEQCPVGLVPLLQANGFAQLLRCYSCGWAGLLRPYSVYILEELLLLVLSRIHA